MKYLGYERQQLLDMNGYWTAKEIEQQPASWTKAQEMLVASAKQINQFLTPLLARGEMRIIFTGAGTSSFIGSCIAPALSSLLDRQVEAIATTDLVSAPDLYFRKSVPTLLVSFARSGNSPESIATVEIADRMIDECSQLVLSCNSDGELLKRCAKCSNAFTVLLPDETNDRSFAMTSSFSTMLLCALSIFSGIDGFTPCVARLAAKVRQFINDRGNDIRQLADDDYRHAAFLGSSIFKGLAQEASLKLLELSDGRIFTSFDTSLGVRHGPKAGLSSNSLVVIFMSNDAYTRKYDQDMLSEIVGEGYVKRVVALTAAGRDDGNGAEFFAVDGVDKFTDIEMLFPYTVFAQIFAFHQAIRAGCQPDSPNASGTVNRVVQGVTIHPLER